jgi:ATP-binding cassette subfamily F protein 3
LDAPHLVILDEPTNHLDIESREALALALGEYQGAVILVSHDPHLINAIADQLWLVKGGTVKPYHDDLNAYKTMLLSERGGGGAASEAKKKAKGPKQKRLSNSERRKLTQPLQEDVSKCEERIIKLEDMKAKVAQRMADPKFYTSENTGKIEELTKKHGEILQAMEKAETLWEQASEALYKAKRR